MNMPKPNIVLILTDTQATNVLGCYGRHEMQTPHIDRLAQSGIRFQRAYTTCPVCTPARAGLFTGIYPHTSGPWTNNLPLGDNIHTMGQRFQDGGYETAYIGKWHLDGHDYFGTGICPPGWNEAYWYDGKRYLAELSEPEIQLWRRGLNSYEDLMCHAIRPEFTWAHRVSDRALHFLETHAESSRQGEGQPFLLVASYDEPHHPYTCPPEYVEKFLEFDYDLGPGGLDTLTGKPGHQRDWAQSSQVHRKGSMIRQPMYFGCNSFVDAEIGRVIDAVHELSLENTWIIFTSDHGDLLGAHGLHGKGPVMYEEITHIPLIVELPGQASGGRTVQTTVSHIDLLPTMLQAADLPASPILEGESLLPLLKGQEQPGRGVMVEFQRYEIEHDSWGGFQPVRCWVNEHLKLVVNLLHTDELYDLERDPGEVNNLIDHPDYARARDLLHDQLLNWMYARRDPFRGPVWERRLWRYSRRYQWKGSFRPRPADGYAPEVRDYDTGLPSKGVKIEFGDKK